MENMLDESALYQKALSDIDSHCFLNISDSQHASEVSNEESESSYSKTILHGKCLYSDLWHPCKGHGIDMCEEWIAIGTW